MPNDFEIPPKFSTTFSSYGSVDEAPNKEKIDLPDIIRWISRIKNGIVIFRKELSDVAVQVVEPIAKAEIEELKKEAEKITSSTLAKISEQLGSNRGGWYEDTLSKEKFYVKFYTDFNQARVEYIANAIYAKLGINAAKSEFKTIDGEESIASSEISGAKAVYLEEVKRDADIRSGFIADAYLGNWDVTGANYDNIIQDAQGRMYRIDNGGTLTFRARGGQKEYIPDNIPEIENMRNPIFPSGRVFGDITEDEMQQQAERLVKNLSEEDIDEIVAQSGCFGKLAETIRLGLKGRRKFLIKRFGIDMSEKYNKITSVYEETNPREEEVPDIIEILQQDPQIDIIYGNYKIQSYLSVKYNVPEYSGHELRPGRRMVFIIPPEFKDRVVRDVILFHRKAEKYLVNIGADSWDPHGAYTRLELHNAEDGEWQQWVDPKGYKPDKFAEPRPASNPGCEVLHDWVATVGEVKPDAIRITNVGQNNEYSVSQVHGVEVIFFPEAYNVQYKERVYCTGTEFANLDEGIVLPKYGGGSHTEGKYIGAIALNKYGGSLYELGEDPGPDAQIRNNKLFIKLNPDSELLQIEIAVGDTEHLNVLNPKTNRYTRLGFAKLWVGIRRADSSNIEWFMENLNIPPQGVFAGGPLPDRRKIQEGDELVIESRSDTAYLMGWRLAYKEKNESPALAENT